ncbi:MAG: alpha/beta hydrolase [Firmicutes bacterium]|nr:alpha/beta hydrolase [Bacillota bacterium]
MDTILFLHGWGGNEYSFAPILPMFEKHFKCISLSLPMFQRENGENEPDKPWTLEDYAEFIERKLDEHQVEKCHIVAHSFGCRVAVLLVRRNAERFKKLVMTGAAGIKKRRSIRTMLKILIYKARKKLASIFGREFVSKNTGSEDYKKLSDYGKITFHNVIRRDLRYQISQIEHDTLLVFGSMDKATPVKLGKKWYKLAKNAKLKVYEKSGHFCYIDERERFIVDSFAFLGVVYM